MSNPKYHPYIVDTIKEIQERERDLSNRIIQELKSKNKSCKSCSSLSTKKFMTFCKEKNKNVPHYSICPLHKEK